MGLGTANIDLIDEVSRRVLARWRPNINSKSLSKLIWHTISKCKFVFLILHFAFSHQNVAAIISVKLYAKSSHKIQNCLIFHSAAYHLTESKEKGNAQNQRSIRFIWNDSRPKEVHCFPTKGKGEKNQNSHWYDCWMQIFMSLTTCIVVWNSICFDFISQIWRWDFAGWFCMRL